MDWDYQAIARMIDHSLLGPAMSDAELEDGCRIARDYGVASVCIKPYFVSQAAKALAGSAVKTGTTVGFPHGAHKPSIKVEEARQALEDGAEELDMVVNIGKVKSGDWNFVRDDIAGVLDVTRSHDACLKVIFENCYLTDDEKIRLCEICGELRVDYVKTSTGYGTGGATDEDLRLMRAHSPDYVRIKAAGGVRSLDRLLEVRALGVDRVGASRTVDILDECKRRLGLG